MLRLIFILTSLKNGEKNWGYYVRLRLAVALTRSLSGGVLVINCKEGTLVLIHQFKAYCALLFFKGVLLVNADGILIQQTEHVQAARQIRFTNVLEIIEKEAMIKAHIFEAIAVEKSGLKVELKKTTEFAMADEFKLR